MTETRSAQPIDEEPDARRARREVEGNAASKPQCLDDDCVEADPAHGERIHFLEVCYSFIDYKKDAIQDLNRLEATLKSLSKQDLYMWGQLDPGMWLRGICLAVEANRQFLQLLPCPDVAGAPLYGPHAEGIFEVPDGHCVAHRNSSKVRSTLRQFVRDWAVEGKAERDANYGPVMDALKRHLPPSSRERSGGPKYRVLCPGSGLARLPFELARCGYAAQGNEFSYHMLLGSHFVLNRTDGALQHVIFPYALSLANRRGHADHMKCVRVPDIYPPDEMPLDADLSMAAGEFVEVYRRQTSAWDAIATCFFLDTAKNIVLYIMTLASIVKCGGLWVNLGPLLYHFADTDTEFSVELSWTEVRTIICQYFDIIEESQREAYYTANPDSLFRTLFKCLFFVARRNAKPVVGTSKPVF